LKSSALSSLTPSVADLVTLLGQRESGSLEFKREWYRLEEDPKEKKSQKAELVKDIISLANGSLEAVGDPAVLIVGASDKLREDGLREVSDVGPNLPTAAQILDVVRPFCNPPMDSLQVIPFQHDTATLFAIFIPPTPHVFELADDLRTRSRVYSKYSVLVRRGDSIDLASSKEREALGTLKRIKSSELRNPPPTSLAAAVGATTAGILVGQIGSRDGGIRGAAAGGLVGSLIGGLIGTLMGLAYELFFQQTGGWHQEPGRRRAAVMSLAAAMAAATWIVSGKLANMFTPKLMDESD